MKIHIIAADSLGVRSMATLVELSSTHIALDCSAALGPRRYGLPPHFLEIKELENSMGRIFDAVKAAEVVVITHYHYDHYLRDFSYPGKILLVKDPKENINRSQKRRAAEFLKKVNAEVIIADGKNFESKLGLDIEFSKPLWHGEENTRLGYVLAVRMGDFIFASDVQGFFGGKGIEFVEEHRPKILYLSGFPTHFIGFKLPMAAFERYERAMKKVIEATGDIIIVDHHALRDRRFMKFHRNLKDFAEEIGVKFLTAAEFAEKPVKMFEAFRKELWNGAELEDILRLSSSALRGEFS